MECSNLESEILLIASIIISLKDQLLPLAVPQFARESYWFKFFGYLANNSSIFILHILRVHFDSTLSFDCGSCACLASPLKIKLVSSSKRRPSADVHVKWDERAFILKESHLRKFRNNHYTLTSPLTYSESEGPQLISATLMACKICGLEHYLTMLG